MTKSRFDGFALLLLGAAIFLLVGLALKHVSSISMGDFKVVYYSARCLLKNGDPYLERDVLRVYQAEGRERPSESVLNRQVMTRYFYPPTAFVFTAPFAFLGFGPGQLLWMLFSAGGLILAAVLAFDLAADFAPVISGALLGFLLMNSLWLLMIGNSAAIVVSLCSIAVWCFLKERFVPVGVLCLALSLAVKPHDSGLVWLFFLLAGGTFRKRALQTLLVFAVLCLPAVLWVTHVSPHWIQEARSNMLTFSGVTGLTDPAATGMAGRYLDSFVQLQSAVSIVWADPLVYNSITYVICGVMLLIWAIVTVRLRPIQGRSWLALAAITPLSMLPIYHLQHDAKLLILTVPACAMLWSEGGIIGLMAVIVTAAGIAVNGDIFTTIRIALTHQFVVPQPNLPSEMLTVVLTRPGPLFLLLMAVFYMWVYIRHPLLAATAPSPASEQVTQNTR